MKGLLDDSRIEGPHEVHISVRPTREAWPIEIGESSRFFEQVELLCQIWGGAVAPLIPASSDGKIDSTYRAALAGAMVDGLRGLPHPFDIFKLDDAVVSFEPRPDQYGSQIALATFEYRRQKKYLELEIVELEESDPWRGIYAACLGLLPSTLDPSLIKVSHVNRSLAVEDFFRVRRVRAVGSIDDLVERLAARDRLTPRLVSMGHLAYGNAGSSNIRDGKKVLPGDGFARYDAGPNVIVLCTRGNVEDLALLWNLRGAHGDFRPLPIGLPIDVATPAVIASLADRPDIARNGFSATSAYVTSASLDLANIRAVVGDQARVASAPIDEMLTFGQPGGFSRDEVLVWTGGEAQLVPLPTGFHDKVLNEGRVGPYAQLSVDVRVAESPFPEGGDIRVDTSDGDFYGGAKSRWGSVSNLSQAHRITWPSTMLMARAVAARRGFDLRESEPGRASRTALETLGTIGNLGNLSHAPLLALLEEMAARHGFGWYKDRLRGSGTTADPLDSVGRSVDDLPERSFSDFKRVLGNSDSATKNWLLWAERSGLVVKGFPLQCERCHAKQWIPVEAFAPPVVCRGCAESMATPFGNRHVLEFKFRLSERLRRVYEHDAMGHLLTADFLSTILRDRLIGVHPGVEVSRLTESAVVGETDVLLLTTRGELVPVEVKRSASGVTTSELEKLDSLTLAFRSRWSAVAICQYAHEAGDVRDRVELRHDDTSYRRLVLTYDALLNPRAFWGLGSDPFQWAPLSEDEILEREQAFVKRFASYEDNWRSRWEERTMLTNPADRLATREEKAPADNA